MATIHINIKHRTTPSAVAQDAGGELRPIVSALRTVHVTQASVQSGTIVVLPAVAAIGDQAHMLTSAGHHGEAVVIGVHVDRRIICRAGWRLDIGAGTTHIVHKGLAIVAAVQRGIDDDGVVKVLVNRRLAHVKDVAIGGPGRHVAGVGAVVLTLQAHRITKGQSALAGPGVEGLVIAAIDGGGHQSGAHKVAHVILLAVVRIRKDALRGALEVALDAERMAWPRLVGAAAQAGVAIIPIGHVTGLYGYVHPAVGVAHAGGQQFAGLADGTRALAALAGVRFRGCIRRVVTVAAHEWATTLSRSWKCIKLMRDLTKMPLNKSK